MSIVRPARPRDADWMGRVHVAAWDETYAGLLPPEELAARSAADRAAQWARAIAGGRTRIAVAEGLGFAAAGPQREAPLAEAGWPGELYAIYLLRAGQGRGLGRALFTAVCGAGPFTCCVLEGNTGAVAFYEAMRGRRLMTRDERIGDTAILEHVYGWEAGALPGAAGD